MGVLDFEIQATPHVPNREPGMKQRRHWFGVFKLHATAQGAKKSQDFKVL
jgi:hypothetical protein